MKNIIRFPDQAAVEETAASWLVKIDQGELTREQEQAFRSWIEQDSRHRLTFTRLAKLWGDIDTLNLLAPLFPLEQTLESALHAAPQASPEPAREESAGWLRRHRLPAFAGMAASISLALGLLIVLKTVDPAPNSPTATEPVELVYQTELGKQSQATLSDGSLITLNTQSKLRVHFTDNERSIYLVNGEAHFDVAKNPRRPFVVYAGSGEVRAVGTAFSVRVDEQQEVKVAVAEGTVQVVANLAPAKAAKNAAAPAKQPRSSLTLKKGGTASYHGAIETYAYVEEEKLEQKLAWKNGKWIFDGETLAEVIAEANRYSSKKIQITDPTIADLRVGGYFNAGDIDALLRTLASGFNIRVQHGTDSIQLSSLTPQSAE